MAEVLRFPAQMNRQWRVYASQLRPALLDIGCSLAEVEHVLGKLEPVYLRSADTAVFSGDPSRAIDEMNRWVHQHVSMLLLDVALRDLELYRLRGS